MCPARGPITPGRRTWPNSPRRRARAWPRSSPPGFPPAPSTPTPSTPARRRGRPGTATSHASSPSPETVGCTGRPTTATSRCVDARGRRGELGADGDDERRAVAVDDDVVPIGDRAGQQHARELVAHFALDEPAQGPRPVGGVVAFQGEPLLGGLRDLQRDAPVLEPSPQAVELQAHDLA